MCHFLTPKSSEVTGSGLFKAFRNLPQIFISNLIFHNTHLKPSWSPPFFFFSSLDGIALFPPSPTFPFNLYSTCLVRGLGFYPRLVWCVTSVKLFFLEPPFSYTWERRKEIELGDLFIQTLSSLSLCGSTSALDLLPQNPGPFSLLYFYSIYHSLFGIVVNIYVLFSSNFWSCCKLRQPIGRAKLFLEDASEGEDQQGCSALDFHFMSRSWEEMGVMKDFFPLCTLLGE